MITIQPFSSRFVVFFLIVLGARKKKAKLLTEDSVPGDSGRRSNSQILNLKQHMNGVV